MQAVKPDVRTEELNALAEKLIKEAKVVASFKWYKGFPASLCTSVNDEIVHCPPCARCLKQGDIIGLDLGIKHKGYHVDMALTVPVDKISDEAKRLIRICQKALYIGIGQVKPGNHVNDIGAAIQEYVESEGFNVVRDLVGHGVGEKIHEPPQIPNYGKPGAGAVLKEGMCLAIEPMITMGDYKVIQTIDGFGFKTADGSLSAHFEHTVAVTKKGCLILTR